MGNSNYNIVIPILSKDFDKFSLNISAFRKYLPVKKFVLLGDDGLKEAISRLDCSDIIYINENSIVDAANIKDLMKSRIEGRDFGEKSPLSRFGWYYQQFLKLAYSYKCEDEYYIVWDADTVPIRQYRPFDDAGVPFFDVKDEYHIPYFNTLDRLSAGALKKVNDYSYISEHMILKCEYVKEMIKIFAGDCETDTITAFCKRVFECIDDKDLRKSGFSEFESYGCFVMKYHATSYRIREWKSLRDATSYFAHESFGDKEAQWLNSDYDAVSFEKFIQPNKIYRKVCADKRIRDKYSFSEASNIAKKRDRILGLPGRILNKLAGKIKRK